MSEKEKEAAGAKTPAAKSAEKAPVQKTDAEVKLEKELAVARELIAKQSTEMERLTTQVGSKHTIVNVGGKSYKSLAKGSVIIDGKSVDAAELVKDSDTVKKLIESGSGLFIEVKKKGGK